MKIAICIPNTGTIKAKTMFALVRMIKKASFDYTFITKEGSIIHYSREELVKQAIKEECTHILFIDSDMFFEADAAEKLLKRDKDVIGVPYNLRALPLITTLKDTDEKGEKIWEEHGDLVKCAAVATGFLLIKLDVFEKLTEPWFFWESNDKGEVVQGEDFWFCRKAREAGYEIWADRTIAIKHIGDYQF